MSNIFDTLKEVSNFATTKWGHVIFATAAFAAPLVFQALGQPEPAWVSTVLNVVGSGALARGYAGYLDIVKSVA